MKINTRIAAAFALGSALLAAPVMAQDSPVIGVWNTEARTDFGTFVSTVTVAHDGGAYTVTIVDTPPPGAGEGMPALASTVTDVTVDGANFSFKRNLESPQGAMVLTYNGSVAGDALTAEVASAFGNIPVTGTRAE
jgi:hypothetical protein